MEKGTCSRGKWEINKYPCSHVLSVCCNLSLNSWQHIQKYYSIKEYCITCTFQFFSFHHEAYWSKPTLKLILDHSFKHSEKGRPCSTRLWNEIDIKEGYTPILYGIYKTQGNDRRKYPSRPRKVSIEARRLSSCVVILHIFLPN